MLGVCGAALGQRHAVAGAAEQIHAQKLLQRGDLPRHRALRQRQLLRGAGVAFVAGGGVKAGQGLKGRYFSAHGVRNIHNMLKMQVNYAIYLIAV